MSITWSYGPAPEQKTRRVTHAFRTWHSAARVGFWPDSVRLDGRELTERELDRLTAWIAAQGAWRSSLLEFGDAWRLLESVVSGGVRNVRAGACGGGRRSAHGLAEKFLRDGGERVQGELWL